jgi:WD40-like Beta Propeller Repeat
MSRTAGIRLATAAVVLACLLSPAGAAALYGNAADGVEGAEMVSADFLRHEQGDDSTRFAAVSGDGRFVAIQTRARNFYADDDPDPAGQFRVGGVFRFDTQTRGLTKVADGDLLRESDNALVTRGANNPSISADGRFVAFTTGQRLVVADANDNLDVYVRDMSKAASAPDAYVLVSALDGGGVAATYAPPAEPGVGGNPGTAASPGVAISADGNRVAFTTAAASNLPTGPAATVAAGQLLVRDIAAQSTTLVTTRREAATGLMSGEPAGGALGGAISADGSTVAWTGGNGPAQTRMILGENTDPGFNYFLWRRAPFGPDQPTRRITGIGDPDDAVCRQQEEGNPGQPIVFNPNATGPCFGPLTDQEAARADISGQLPTLSGDGNTVAFLTGAGPRPLVQNAPGLDLYLTEMGPGATRKATVELTRDNFTSDLESTLPIGGIAMSSNGRFLAMTSGRTRFPLPALQLVGESRTVPGPQELYVVDLRERTIERVTHSISGGDVDGGAIDGVSISSDGSSIAFASFAGNLFRGDANGRSDAFLATRVPEVPSGPPSGGGSGGGGSSQKIDRAPPRVIVRGKTKKGGVVVLTITVPAAGGIKAVATARTGSPPKPHTIASRKTHVRGKGTFKVVMRAAAAFRSALRGGRELEARVRVTFSPKGGGRKLHGSTTVEFAE